MRKILRIISSELQNKPMMNSSALNPMWACAVSHASHRWNPIIIFDGHAEENKKKWAETEPPQAHSTVFISLLSTVVVVFTAPFTRRSTVRPRQSTSFSQAISYASRARAEQVRRASSLQPWPASTPKRVVGTPKKKSGVDDDYSLLLLL